MSIYTIDFETYYDREYTLSKLQTSAYIRDPRFKVHMVGVKKDDQKTVVLTDAQFRRLLPSLNLQQHIVCCHHAAFDGLILSHHYGVKPRFFLCTMSMARGLAPLKSASLKAVAERYNLGVKGHEVQNTLGKASLTPLEWQALAEYCRNDVDLTWAILQRLKTGYPVTELHVIDITIKMFTDPIVVFNAPLLQQEQSSEITRKKELLDKCGADRAVLASNQQFAALLESLGVEVPMKLSPTALKKGQEIRTYALGKSDEGFKALLNREDEAVLALCEARLGVKSTINETRAGRFLSMAEHGAVPVYLTYYGAHTGRFSGSGDKCNWQNLSRGSNLRLALEAPEGHKLVVADSSQIEARVLASLAGEEGLLESFRRADASESDTDVYTDMASRVFQRPITKKDKFERQCGKALVLGCGFGMGAGKFQALQRVGMLGAPPNIFGEEMLATLGVDLDFFTMKHGAKALKDIPPGWEHRQREYLVHYACCQYLVDMYREANPRIVRLWGTANVALSYCVTGRTFEFCYGPVLTTAQNAINLPNGMQIIYDDLQRELKDGGKRAEYSKMGKKHREKLFGGSVVENCLSAETEVLTPYGWARIVDITPETKVWDGEQWVSHDGLVEKGVQPIISFGGVLMTPDHLVYTTKWEEAQNALHRDATSSFQRSYRLPHWQTGCKTLHRAQKRKGSLGSLVRLRGGHYQSRVRNHEEWTAVVRLSRSGASRSQIAYSRNVASPCIWGLAGNDRPLPSSFPQGVQELRSTGYYRLPGVAQHRQKRVPSVLGGYGANLSNRVGAGPDRQQYGVLQRKLPLDHSLNQLPQSEEKSPDRHPQRADACLRSLRSIRNQRNNSTLPPRKRVADGTAIRQAGLHQPRLVYDLLNCGPNNRFTVRGDNGKPFLVHNCTQAVARIVMTDAMRAISTKYRVVLTVHDEIVCCVPDAQAEKCFHYMKQCLNTPPKWAPELPLNAAGGIAQNYCK